MPHISHQSCFCYTGMRKATLSHLGTYPSLQVWRTLDGYSQLIFNMAPMLRTPISYAQRWFTNVR